MGIVSDVASYKGKVTTLLSAQSSFFDSNPSYVALINDHSTSVDAFGAGVDSFVQSKYQSLTGMISQGAIVSSISNASSTDVSNSMREICAFTHLLDNGGLLDAALGQLDNLISGATTITTGVMDTLFADIADIFDDWDTIKGALDSIENTIGRVGKYLGAIGSILGDGASILAELSDCFPGMAVRTPELSEIKSIYDSVSGSIPEGLSEGQVKGYLFATISASVKGSSSLAGALSGHVSSLSSLRSKYGL